MQILKDIRYLPENGFRGTGDLFLPEPDCSTGKIALSIHGGGWASMDKDSFAGVAAFLAENGLAVFNINYRLAGAAPFPACAEDCLAAADFVIGKNIPELNGFDCSRLLVIGASAGGHLALMTGLKLGRKRALGIAAISAIADLMPDFTANRERYSILFGHEPEGAEMISASPVELVAADSPPMFLTHYINDRVVPVESSVNFIKKAKSLNAEVAAYLYDNEREGQGHAIWIPGSEPHRLYPDIEEKITDFILKLK